MKKFLSLFLVAVMLTACVSGSTYWSKSNDNVTECGGKVGKTEYKAISIIFDDSQNVESTIEQKVNEGYDAALAVYEEGTLKFNIEMSSKYTNEEAQELLNKIIEQTNADGTYTQEIFVNKVKDFMSAKWQ